MSVPELQKADNGTYYVHWTDGRRSKRISTRTKDLAAAKAFLGQWLLMEHTNPDPANGSTLTTAQLWEVYTAKHTDVKTSSPETARYSWQNLEPHFGALRPTQITQDVVEEYERKRYAGKIGRPSKAATVRRELGALLGCFGWCAAPKRKIILPAAVPVIDLPPESAPRDRWLRLDEVQKLFDAAAKMRRGDRLSRVERFLWLALETAARKEAIFQLTWDRVDLETGMIDYDVPGRRKTKKRRAHPPISKALMPVLKTAYAERVNNHVLDNEAEIWKAMKAVAKAAGVEGVSPHVLRHTAATHMARNGIPLYSIAGVLGNTMVMVEKVYAKHSRGALSEAVNSISAGVLGSSNSAGVNTDPVATIGEQHVP